MKKPTNGGKSRKVSVVKLSNKQYSKSQKSPRKSKGRNTKNLNMGAKGNLPKHLRKSKANSQTNDAVRASNADNDVDKDVDVDEDVDASDMDSDTDERYLNESYIGAGFLQSMSLESGNQVKQKGKRKRAEREADELAFENLPREFSSCVENKKLKNLLPIKGKMGLVKQFREIESETEMDDDVEAPEDDDQSENERSDGADKDQQELAYLSPKELLAIRHEKIEKYKRKIAHLASSVTENPQQHLSSLVELKSMLDQKDPLVQGVKQKMLMLTLVELFKDIIPGYKIRTLSEQEDNGTMLSKETKSLHGFENSLVKCYKDFLLKLESSSKVLLQSRKKLAKRNAQLPSKSEQSLAELAIDCLCQLLLAHPHFNFSTNIIVSLVPFAACTNENVVIMCCNTFRMMYKQDKLGSVSLEAVKAITRLIKERTYNVPPKVLDTFLSLRINDISVMNLEEKSAKRMTHKEKLMSMSRREFKRSKKMKELDRQLEETAATESKQKKMKFQTDIVKQVFLTYFRILKKEATSVLLSSVLEGLAKFSHLINVEFFDDLVAVLHRLIKTEVLDYRQSLHCIQTVVTILAGQGEALNIDPMRFYTHLYKSLFSLHAGSTNDDFLVAISCLDSLIIRRRTQVSFHRVLAFTKRLCTLSLQLHHHSTIAALALVRNFLQTHLRADILLDTDSSQSSSGIYMPELDEPEHCNANATSLWELFPLQRHYHPIVKKFAKNIALGTPSDGNGQLSQELSRSKPADLFINYHPNESEFNPPMQQLHTKIGRSKNHKEARNFWMPIHKQHYEEMTATLEKIEISEFLIKK